MSRYGLFCGVGLDYAIPIERLLRVLPVEQCFRLPRLPEAISGVIVEAGQLIPQLDLAFLLQRSTGCQGSAGYQVLVESECGAMALLAERSCGIVADQKGELVSVDEQPVRGIVSEFHCQEKVFQVLDIDSLAIGLIQESW